MIDLICMYALSTLPLSKQLLMYSQPYFLMGLRMTLAGVFLFLYCFARKQLPVLRNAHITLYIRIMFFALFFPYCLRYWALAQPSSPLTSVLYHAAPFVTYVCALWCGVEKINRITISGLALGLCGLLAQQNVPVWNYFQSSYGLAEVALLASVISFSYGWICIRYLVVNMQANPVHVNAITMLASGIFGLCTAFWCEPAPYMICVSTAIPLLLAVVLISNCITHTWYAMLLRTYSLTFMQYTSLLIPLCMQLATTPAISLLCIGLGFILLYTQEQKSDIFATNLLKRITYNFQK